MMLRDAIRNARARAARQRGVTLIEMMVALVVGLILTGGAIQIFMSSRQGFAANDAMARIQENGRYALEFLARDIRTAAFWGCAQELEMNSRLNPGGGVDFEGPEFSGTEAGGPNNSDTLTIRHATQNTRLQLQNSMPSASSALVVNADNDVQVGDILIVTDCVAADVFQVTNTQNSNASIVHNSGGTLTPGNATGSLSQAYDTSATVYTAEEKVYSLATNADGERVLQRTVNGGAPVELVAGVRDMQIAYGVDFDNDEVPNAYLAANEVPDNDGDGAPDWEEVMAVRVELLLASADDNVVESAQQYTIDGTTTTAADRRMYQVFTTTTGIRNRLP
jgi:type IV pilus assembly protein PilW